MPTHVAVLFDVDDGAQGGRRRGGGRGGPDPRTFKNRVGRPPRFDNEVAKIRYFSDF